MSIFITSDWHFCHNKEFLYKPRGFNSIEEMNEAIIERHNAVVSKNDDVYCLGDCMLLDNEKGAEYISRLNGNIHLINGNHDTNNRISNYMLLPNVVECGSYAEVLKYHKYNFYLSHYPTLTSNYDMDKPLKARVINLCGHSHTQDKFQDFDKGLIYHVEMDAHNCYPVNIETIISDIKERL